MNVIDIMEAIEAEPRGNARLAAVARLAADNQSVRKFFADTLDPFITFGVQQIPMWTNSGQQPMADWADKLFILGARLAARELTGNAAQQAMEAFLADCDDFQAKWTTRYLRRDLRLDVGAKAFNKAMKSAGQTGVTLFEVPLAEPHDKVKVNIFCEGRWVWQPKLDGARCVAIVSPDGIVSLKSRTGKPWKNFESIRLALQETVDKLGLVDVVFDGEVVSLDLDGFIDFQALQKTMQRGDGVEVGVLRYVCFDYALVGAEWRSPVRAYGKRLDDLTDLVPSRFGKLAPTTNINGIPMARLDTDQRVVVIPSQDYAPADNFGAQCRAYVDQGFEGAMLRRTDCPPVNKRSRALIKVKTFQDGEGVCVGLTEGEGKRAGKLGALVLKWSNGVEVRCGSGLSDAKLAELTADPPVGKKVTVKFFELTADGVPRFPIFKCVRAAEDTPEGDE